MNYIYWPVTKVLPDTQDIVKNSQSTDGVVKKAILIRTTKAMLIDFRQPPEPDINSPQAKGEIFDLAQGRTFCR